MTRLLATYGEAPEPWLDALAALAARLAGTARDFGFRSMAASAADGFRHAARSGARHANPAAATADRVDATTKGPSAEGNDRYDRFKREIVPHLDAAYNFARFLSRNPDAA